jgi:hypothetical protein
MGNIINIIIAFIFYFSIELVATYNQINIHIIGQNMAIDVWNRYYYDYMWLETCALLINKISHIFINFPFHLITFSLFSIYLWFYLLHPIKMCGIILIFFFIHFTKRFFFVHNDKLARCTINIILIIVYCY